MNKRIYCLLLAAILGFLPAGEVYATTISDAKKEKAEAESRLESVNESIENIAVEKEEAEAEIEIIDEQLVDILLTIDIIEQDIVNKEKEIEEAQANYDAAVQKESDQREAMKKRIKFMYEKGDASYLELFLRSQSISDAVNKADYIEKLYEYDRQLLLDYQETKQEVYDYKLELDTEMDELEEVREDSEDQKRELQALIDEKQAEVENFDILLSAERAKAKQYKAEINAKAAEIKKLEEEAAAKKKAEEEAKKKAAAEAKKKAEEEAAKKAEEQDESSDDDSNEDKEEKSSENSSSKETSSESSSSGESSKTSSGSGSAKGQEIADYACRFVGNPYVAGGTSLTEGCDCSGFTSAVYSHFGYSLPRTSSSQAAYGREVSYSDAQPGDIIYYGGHVAIYIGNNTIVHASTASTGIKYSSAFYRSIITVRRIV
mgnify:CR=1 FL=1